MDNLISVIVPVYNVETYLERCIDSIIHQTYQNLEIILVDDGSTDSSSIICDAYLKQDNRMRVIHKQNGGLSDARNEGLKIAKGAYYSFIDSDDYIAKDTLELMYKNIIKFDCDIAICNIVRVYEDGQISEFYCPCHQITIYEDDGKYETLKQPSVCNKLFKAELFENIKFPYGKFYEDTYVYHELLYKANKIVLTGHIGYMYFFRKGSILGQKIYTDKYFDFLEAIWLRASFLLEHSINDYGRDACLSYYVAMSHVYRYIKKTTKNKKKYEQAIERYKRVSIYILKSHINIKQKIRVWLLRFFPKLHNKIYEKDVKYNEYNSKDRMADI